MQSNAWVVPKKKSIKTLPNNLKLEANENNLQTLNTMEDCHDVEDNCKLPLETYDLAPSGETTTKFKSNQVIEDSHVQKQQEDTAPSICHVTKRKQQTDDISDRGSDVDDKRITEDQKDKYFDESVTDDEEDNDPAKSNNNLLQHQERQLPSLIFPTAKLCFIFEKMRKQAPSSQTIKHASKLLIANAKGIKNEKPTTIQKLMDVILRKEIFDEVIMNRNQDVCQEYINAIIAITESDQYIMPVAFYHLLVAEQDLNSHQDYPGLHGVLEKFGLLPAAATSSITTNNDVSPLHCRLHLNTMTFALLELWPESVPIGSALFKQIFSSSKSLNNPNKHAAMTKTTLKHCIATTINLILRCLGGESGSNGDVQISAACRFVGNLLNVAETATRKAIACEVYHLVSYEGSSRSSKLIPDQIINFIAQLTLLTYKRKDQRLDMIGLLACVLNDHISAAPTSTIKRAVPAMKFTFEVLPFDIAVGMAQETMISNTNSYVRISIMNNLVQVWKSRTETITTEISSSQLDRKLIPSCLWELIDMFLMGDPIEKVRLTCIDAISVLGSTISHGKPIILSLPCETILSLIYKCADISKKVQTQAMKVIQTFLAVIAPSTKMHHKLLDEKDQAQIPAAACESETAHGLVMAKTLNIFKSQEQFYSRLCHIILGLSITMRKNQSAYHESVKLFICSTSDTLEFPFLSQVTSCP